MWDTNSLRWSITNIINHNEALVNRWLEKYFKKIMERFQRY